MPDRDPAAPSASLSARFSSMDAADRRLCLTLVVLALGALAVGMAYGLAMALARSGALGMSGEAPYRVLTVHGTAAFFYWLSIGQAAIMIMLSAVENGGRIAWRPLARVGTVLVGAAFLTSEYAAFAGTPLLYDANPALGLEDPAAVATSAFGYVLSAAGLAALAASAIAGVLRSSGGGLSALGFGLFAWAGFLIVSSMAAVNAFLPNLLWGLGAGPFPAGATTDWHILFHNMHYLPLMATVLVWYALARALTGTASVYGTAFSKGVFASYLFFVPPTSLYHMFLEPGLPEEMRIAGSLLSLFVSVPTVTAFLIVVGSLEAHARANGARGAFGWMRRLPWAHPAMSNMAAAMLAMLVGLVFAFVLIQEAFAPLLSDTFFVPAYFHFFAVGTITQTFLAAFMVAVPALTGRPLWRPDVLRWTPWVVLAGLAVFGAAGIAAGYLGVPRRTVDVAYDGASPAGWRTLLLFVGIGGTVFATGLAVSVFGVLRTLATAPSPAAGRLPSHWPEPAGRGPAWTAPVAVALLVLAMTGMTAWTFEFLEAMPVVATGDGGH